MTPTYKSWQAMKDRCIRPKTNRFENYGGRGITVCDRWGAFEAFLADMGERPINHTLERIDSNGHYEPTNCRWATPHDQARNTRTNVWIEANGERLCMTDWAARLGVTTTAVWRRLLRGWDPVRAVTEPAHPKGFV